MKEELKTALEAIGVPSDNNSLCWARKLPDDALEFLYAVEAMWREDGTINKQIAAKEFNRLFEIRSKPITLGMVENHFHGTKGKGCACWKGRDYYS